MSTKEKNKLWIWYSMYLKDLDNNQRKNALCFEDWVEENLTKCLSCGEIIFKEDYNSLETCDGYYCGSCRP